MIQRRFKRNAPGKIHARRTGILSVWAVIAMLACVCCVSLVANTTYLSVVRSESVQCAQAAALSAGRTLLTDDILKANLQPFEVESRYLKARKSALNINQLYRTRAKVPLLLDSHIAIGTVVKTQEGSMLLQNSVVPNRIQLVLTNAAGNESAGQLVLSGISGISRGRILARANVSLENRILGFRPSIDCPIPFINLAIPDDSTSNVPGLWSSDIEADTGTDQFEWFAPENSVSRSADRLPEIVITLHADQHAGAPGQGKWIALQTANNPTANTVGNWIGGITSRAHISSQLSGEGQLLTFPRLANDSLLSQNDLSQIAQTLRSIIGQPRIFPLYQLPDGSQAAKEVTETSHVQPNLTRPVAARIMNVTTVSADELQITLQPCVLSTSTAVVSSDTSVTANRYIWRISLSE